MEGEVDEFSVLAENTSKPLMYLCEHAESLRAVIDKAVTVRGGRKALAEKPWFLHCVTPLPLYFAKTHIDQIVDAVEAEISVCRRESWDSRYFGATFPAASGVLPDEDLVERIDRELQEILQAYAG